MDNISGIYKITCYKNNKFYIGSSINIDRRLNEHTQLLRKNKHTNTYLQNSWNEHREQNFRFEIIETIHDISQLLIREKWWLDTTKCYKREIGFNISRYPRYLNGEKRFIDLTGQRFERLVVDKYAGKNEKGKSQWLCKCDCGKEKIVIGCSLVTNNTRSCGCLHDEGNRLKHGHSKKGAVSKTYLAWENMKKIYTNSNDPGYQNHGKRKFTVCKRWLKFANFLEDIGEIPKGSIFKRIDNNKGYYPNNWELSTMKELARNRSNNLVFTCFGKTQLLAEWAEEYNLPYMILYDRIHKLNWPIEKALMTPIRKGKK